MKFEILCLVAFVLGSWIVFKYFFVKFGCNFKFMHKSLFQVHVFKFELQTLMFIWFFFKLLLCFKIVLYSSKIDYCLCELNILWTWNLYFFLVFCKFVLFNFCVLFVSTFVKFAKQCWKFPNNLFQICVHFFKFVVWVLQVHVLNFEIKCNCNV